MTRLILTCIIITVLSINTYAQIFNDTYDLIQNKNYFKAKSKFFENKAGYSLSERKIIAAFIYNAFNKPLKSNAIINKLLKKEEGFPDTLTLKLYSLKTDNLIKRYKYNEAKKNIEYIIQKYKTLLTEYEIKELKNNLNIWTAFQNEPVQRVVLNRPKPIKMRTDKAGLKNLPVRTESDTVDFIFDTGANISTVVKKTAEKLNMKILPVNIEVGTITGQKTNAQLAICPVFYLGEIEIRNVIFLVLSNESLYISDIDHQINGILGFPVIEALRQIKISQDGYFTVTNNQVKNGNTLSMALDGLTPLICIDGKHYSFDTGADETILYQTFYIENKNEIDKRYVLQKLNFSGAGGKKEFWGYKISCDFKINNQKLTLNDIQLLTEKLKPNEVVYGNIGQDMIKQYKSMTINFDKMYINFE